MIDNWPLYLEFQRLENLWEILESRVYNEAIQAMLEEIWERQCAILNSITIQ